jgi:signal transduction histidine kinase
MTLATSDSRPPFVPWVPTLARALRRAALAANLVALTYVGAIALAYGRAGFELLPYAPWDHAPFPRPTLGVAVPALAALPFLALAYARGRDGRVLGCGRAVLWGLAAFVLLKALPRGVFSSGWFAPPLLIVVAAVVGVVPGLVMTLISSAAVGVTAYYQSLRGEAVALDTIRDHVLPIVAIFLATGLLGAVLHYAVRDLLTLEAEQRERISETLKALRRREGLLRHAMRVSTVGDMASMVVHQLKNRLQLIHGYVSVLACGAGGAAERRLEQIRAAVEHSNEMLEGLLCLAHRGQSAVATIDLGTACRAFAERMERLLPAAIALRVRVPSTPSPAVVDPDELEHALLNLVINAKQAMGRGTITIAVYAESDDHVTIAVADDGPGIAPEICDQIFRPYFTTKAKGEGTGLGLTAVDRFMRASGGRVDVESQPGAGATFFLVFPRAMAPQGDRRPARAATA